MTLRDRILALVIVMLWGINFVVIKVGLQGFPPLLLAGMRFVIVALPAIFFIKRPDIPYRWLFLYGITICFGQFALLFWAMKIGMAAGLASLLLQAQAFITLLMGVVLLKETIKPHNVIAMFIAAIGIYILASAQGETKASLTWFTLLLVIGAASFWSMGNITNKVIMKNYNVPTMALIIWSAPVPAISFFVSSFIFEGPTLIMDSLIHIEWHNIFAIGYLSILATIVGYGGWSYLLSRYETSLVAPLSLLVPVFGLFSAMIILDEHLTLLQGVGVSVIAIGLTFNVFGKRLIANRHSKLDASSN
ncbi:EamA family transporter [Vibrio sp. RC27]